MMGNGNLHSVIGQFYFKSKETNEQTYRERDQICGLQRWAVKVVSGYKLPVIR